MDKYRIYEHRAQYYETDQMGIIHHSNYLRWFEEAKIDLMEQAGMSYRIMEEEGIQSPVLEISCKYKSMVRFQDIVLIKAELKEYNGVKMVISYEVSDKESGEIRCLGTSRHCFLNSEGKPVSMKRRAVEFHDLFLGLMS